MYLLFIVSVTVLHYKYYKLPNYKSRYHCVIYSRKILQINILVLLLYMNYVNGKAWQGVCAVELRRGAVSS